MRLAGKVAIVTGAGRGIGRGEAQLLAAEGAAVVVNDRGGSWDGSGADDRPAQVVVDEIRSAGGAAVASYADVADWKHGQELVDLALCEFGRLDALVCNAGILRDHMLFNLSEADWDDVIRVHLKGHFVPLRAAARHWRGLSKQGTPSNAAVVLTSSGSGLYANAGQANYAAAKAGIASLAVVAARELEQYGVRVNCVSPSARTRLTEQTFAVDPRGSADPTGFDALDPDNIAPWVAFLCSDAARHISGQVFSVQGASVSLLEGWRPVRTIGGDDRWTLDELEEREPKLFAGRSAGPPPFPTTDATDATEAEPTHAG